MQRVPDADRTPLIERYEASRDVPERRRLLEQMDERERDLVRKSIVEEHARGDWDPLGPWMSRLPRTFVRFEEGKGMSSANAKERPEPLLQDAVWVGRVLTLRRQRLTTEQVAEKMGVRSGTVYDAVARIRWMADSKSVSSTAMTALDRRLAKQFVAAWYSVGRPRRSMAYEPMDPDTAEAVENAILDSLS